jgi:pimeloyl-ACP methyl ester carboxylesterase
MTGVVQWLERDRDSLTEPNQKVLAAAIGGSRLAVYDDAGHALTWEEPVRVAAELAAFVAALGET